MPAGKWKENTPNRRTDDHGRRFVFRGHHVEYGETTERTGPVNEPTASPSTAYRASIMAATRDFADLTTFAGALQPVGAHSRTRPVQRRFRSTPRVDRREGRGGVSPRPALRGQAASVVLANRSRIMVQPPAPLMPC